MGELIILQEVRESDKLGKGNESKLVDCISCNEPIEEINTDTFRDYPLYIDDRVGPLHPRCYRENIVATKQFAESLDRLWDYN